jgi:ABC-type antimicrobial peptide transport system permease subunit
VAQLALAAGTLAALALILILTTLSAAAMPALRAAAIDPIRALRCE